MPLRTTFLLCTLLLAATAPAAAQDLPSWWLTAQELALEDGYRLADHEILEQLMDSEPELLIMDVRSDYEYATGHIPGALNLEFDLGDRSNLNEDRRQAVRDMLGPDTERPIVIYCRSFR